MKHVTKAFVTAGDATFTIEVPASLQAAPHDYAAHYTYRVQRVDATDRWPAAWFVKVLTGPDNTADYTYMGKLDDFTGQTRTTAKSTRWADTKQLKLLNRILARVWSDDHAAYEQHGFRTHHEGRCGRCGRKLTTPESVERGIGPECAEIMGLAPQPTPTPAPDPAANGTDAAAKPAKRRRKKVAAGVSNGPDRVDNPDPVYASDLHLRPGQWPNTIVGADTRTYHRGNEVYDADGDLEKIMYTSKDGLVLTVYND